jgi:protein-S-isoprenylcysteine O-methyltransferase Ste14
MDHEEKVMRPARPAPNNKIRPTLLFIGGFMAGWALHAWLEFYIDGAGASTMQRVLGALGIGGGIAITWWALSTFMRVRTGIMPDRPARQLVTFGPYRFSRNPMFVGFSAIYVGLAVLLNLVWPLVLLPLVIVVLSTTVIRHEERYMAAEFGDPYQTYCRRVRRWM